MRGLLIAAAAVLVAVVLFNRKEKHVVIDKLEIAYGDKTEAVSVRRLKFRKRAQLFAALRGDLTEFDPKKVPVDRQAEFTVEMISQSVCDDAGKLLYTPDDVDEWDDAKINAYSVAIMKYQTPTVESAAKNS